MKLTVYLGLALQVLALYVQALRIFQTNENGWAALYFRTLSNLLRANGHDIFAMAPAQNHPGSGKELGKPAFRKKPCDYDACPPNSRRWGYNGSRTDLIWINAYPVVAMEYGIQRFSREYWNGEAADIAITGVNHGAALWMNLHFPGGVKARRLGC
ncbi:hypothetical protein S40285_09041 [Stachybotrys chlorohalonatus IBT 40285]|uniref:Survival protein SurE-like phosphatase/nucleotidase domain-containing protein n=1 Tax=Stachybotrys chlorohalonatus (strain IBT 40285) TaxID=1283841 RepID=A0A084QX42_STAC4|nr:hypothetical protein S40285_09041 [Stachybotrys chlorohalonata IBT 40285]